MQDTAMCTGPTQTLASTSTPAHEDVFHEALSPMLASVRGQGAETLVGRRAVCAV